MKAEEVIAALKKRHRPRYNGRAPSWVFFDELRVGAGFDQGSGQRIDAWAMNCWPSRRETVAYEVKVSRSDFLAEIKKPLKKKYALLYSNRFFFVAPEGLVALRELPPEAGLLEIRYDGSIVERVPAPWRDCYPPSWTFVASLARRVVLRDEEQE